MADRWQHIPIFYVDVQGFTTYNADTQQTIVRRVHDMATEAARLFVPEGDVWSTWRRHGTGDGYYFLLIGASPQEALHYALRFNAVLEVRIIRNTARPCPCGSMVRSSWATSTCLRRRTSIKVRRSPAPHGS